MEGPNWLSDLENALKDPTAKERAWLIAFQQWEWESYSPSKQRLTELVQAGVPKRIRGLVWKHLLGSLDLEKKNKDVFKFLSQCPVNPDELGRIRKDINRTFPYIPFFDDGGEGQRLLTLVLRAYCVMDPQVGYCQGMSFIAATLLLQMSDEAAFWMLVTLMKKQEFSGLFSDEVPMLRKYLYILDRLIESVLPTLFSHFKAEQVTPLLFASEWFSTLFTYCFPPEVVQEIWDWLMLEGNIILFRVSLAILKIFTNQLIRLDFQKVVEYLKHIGPLLDAREVMQEANKFQVEDMVVQLGNEFDHPKTRSDMFQ